MPNLESVRRIIGRDITQKYVTDEGGESMIDVGTFTSTNLDQSFNIGFKPKVLIVGVTETDNSEQVYLFTDFGYYNIYDYDIYDYNNRARTVTRHNVGVGSNSWRTSFSDTGFTTRISTGECFYIAIG